MVFQKITKIVKAQKILKILKKKGFEGFIVGGAVRNFYLRLSLEDVDLTTNAVLNDLKNLFFVKVQNEKYASAKIIFENDYFDITTYRKEGPYLDYRHPSYVFLISDVKEDIKRRDFTINGLLMNEKCQIFDYIGGIEDLKKKQIRTIGDPYQKLTEDTLRIMRLFYLQAKLNFKIETQTQKILKKNIFLLETIQAEKLLQEIKKILKQKYFYQVFESFKINNALPFLKGLDKGILFILENKLFRINEQNFFILCFFLNHTIINNFPFRKKDKKIFQKILENLKQEQNPIEKIKLGFF